MQHQVICVQCTRSGWQVVLRVGGRAAHVSPLVSSSLFVIMWFRDVELFRTAMLLISATMDTHVSTGMSVCSSIWSKMLARFLTVLHTSACLVLCVVPPPAPRDGVALHLREKSK